MTDQSGSDAADRRAAGQDLQATAASIRVDAARLAALEDEKLTLDPQDARVDEMSEEAVELAERIERKTRAQRQLSREVG